MLEMEIRKTRQILAAIQLSAFTMKVHPENGTEYCHNTDDCADALSDMGGVALGHGSPLGLGHPCGLGGKCVDEVNGHRCECHVGFAPSLFGFNTYEGGHNLHLIEPEDYNTFEDRVMNIAKGSST